MPKREYGSGGITWITNTKARLSVRVAGGRRTKVVTVVHRDRGGRSAAAAELELFAEELRVQALDPREAAVTVRQMLDEYVDHCRRIGRAQGTIETYVKVFKRVPSALGSLPLSALSSRDLDQLYTQLAAGGMARSTIHSTNAAISAAIEQAVRWGQVDHNEALKATAERDDDSEAEPLTPAEVAMMAIAAATPPEGQENGDVVLTMAVILAALTGARRGELCGFRWDDIDPDGRSITIQRQWVPGDGGQRLETPKSRKGVRRVYLGAEGVRVIDQYRTALRRLLNREPEGWLLSHDAGVTPMRAKSLGAAISKVGRECGLGVTAHRFRKVQAIQLVAAGVDVDTAARRMGHTKGVMFAHYLLGAEDKSVAAAELVEARLIEQGLPIGEIFTGATTPKAPTQKAKEPSKPGWGDDKGGDGG